jgi:Fic family protein
VLKYFQREGVSSMGYITVSEAAKKWGISDRRVRLLCSQDRIEGVIHKGRKYLIPIDAKKPVDERTTKSKTQGCHRQNVFEHSDRLKEELSRNISLSKREQDDMTEAFQSEFAYNSNAIDGNSLTMKEVSSVLDGNVIAHKPLKDHLDIIGHRDAFSYVIELCNQNVPLSENVIKNIHALVLISNAAVKGKYRIQSLDVNDPYVEPIQPYMIKSKMNDLIFENNRRRKKMAPLERIARFHMEFKAIHPFIDGNGRTNRLILNLELMEEGYPPIDIRFSDRKKYFEAFDAYFKDGNPAAMISLLVQYVDEAMEKLMDVHTSANSRPALSASAHSNRSSLSSLSSRTPKVRYEEISQMNR